MFGHVVLSVYLTINITSGDEDQAKNQRARSTRIFEAISKEISKENSEAISAKSKQWRFHCQTSHRLKFTSMEIQALDGRNG